VAANLPLVFCKKGFGAVDRKCEARSVFVESLEDSLSLVLYVRSSLLFLIVLLSSLIVLLTTVIVIILILDNGA